MAGVTRATQVLPLYPIKTTSATIAKAKKLAAGHTRDATAIIWASNRGAAPLQGQIVQFNLKQIGINAEIKLLPRAQQFGDAKVRGAAYDITDEAWGADYNDPYDFLNILLDGTTARPGGQQQLRVLQQRVVQRPDAQGRAPQRLFPEQRVCGSGQGHHGQGSALGADPEPQ